MKLNDFDTKNNVTDEKKTNCYGFDWTNTNSIEEVLHHRAHIRLYTEFLSLLHSFIKQYKPCNKYKSVNSAEWQ